MFEWQGLHHRVAVRETNVGFTAVGDRMNSAARVGLALWLTASAVQAAEPYNGSQPMMCRPTAGHDCLPTENACKKIVPEAGKDLTMRIDIHANSIKTPFRNDPL